MEYTFKLKAGRKTVPVVEFADGSYALAGEFLLAERSILREITAFLNSGEDGSISGNAFTLSIEGDTAVITNDITDKSLSVPTDELRELTEAYRAEVKRLRKRS